MGNVLLLIGVFAVSFIVGYILILRVPPRLHTPLMSMTNAVSAVTILGAMLLFAVEKMTTTENLIGLAAVVLISFNLVGGFVVTDRMLSFFRKKRSHE